MNLIASDTQLLLEEARINAINTVRFFDVSKTASPFVLPTFSIEAQTAALFSETPLFIYDVNQQLIFYEFAGRLSDGVEVRARAAANRLLGAPVYSVYVGVPLDLSGQILLAEKHAISVGLRPTNLPQALVVYSYPKLGLLCNDAAGERVVVDLFEFNISLVERPWTMLQRKAEAPAIWSPLDLIHPASVGGRTEEWDTNLSVISDSEAGPAAAEEYVISGIQSVPQKNERFCAVACAKMILEFHGIEVSQEQIADVMLPKADGSTNENQIKAYSELSDHALVAKLDSTASFLEAKVECQNDRPMKSGVPGHARVVAGWRMQYKGTLTSSWLWILDPWPVGSGKIYWENWDAIPHSNFIYVRPSA